MTTDFVFEIHPADRSELGKGTPLVFAGYVRTPTVRLLSLEVGIKDTWQPIRYLNERREDLKDVLGDNATERSLFTGFWGTYTLSITAPPVHVQFHYRATFANGVTTGGHICNCIFNNDFSPIPPLPDTTSSSDSTIAICLATFQPEQRTLTLQLDSLRRQTHTNWICIVCDDGSDDAHTAMIETLCATDERFHFFPHEQNIGFYNNFERCLRHIPPKIDLIALCDQDDVWYPQKLEQLLTTFSDTTSLAYSDMRLIDNNGTVIADSYWTTRRNNYDDLHVLLAANTITGAASLFRRDVLELALPFPTRIADVYHDHWIALCAYVTGSIEYVSEPLYDYRQHAHNVIGYTGFDRKTSFMNICQYIYRKLCRRTKTLLRDAGMDTNLSNADDSYARRTWNQIRHHLSVSGFIIYSIPRLIFLPLLNISNRYRVFFLEVFRLQYRGLELFCTTLIIRHHTIGSDTSLPRALTSYTGGTRSAARLLAGWVKSLLKGKTTGNRDLYMAISILIYHFDPASFFCRRLLGR